MQWCLCRRPTCGDLSRVMMSCSGPRISVKRSRASARHTSSTVASTLAPLQFHSIIPSCIQCFIPASMSFHSFLSIPFESDLHGRTQARYALSATFVPISLPDDFRQAGSSRLSKAGCAAGRARTGERR